MAAAAGRPPHPTAGTTPAGREPLHMLFLHASVFFALLGLGLGRLSATSAELWAMPRPLLGSFPSDAQPWWQAQGTGIYPGPVCPLS